MIRPRGISSGHFDSEELFIFSVNVQCGGVAVNHSHTDSVLIVLIFGARIFFSTSYKSVQGRMECSIKFLWRELGGFL